MKKLFLAAFAAISMSAMAGITYDANGQIASATSDAKFGALIQQMVANKTAQPANAQSVITTTTQIATMINQFARANTQNATATSWAGIINAAFYEQPNRDWWASGYAMTAPVVVNGVIQNPDFSWSDPSATMDKSVMATLIMNAWQAVNDTYGNGSAAPYISFADIAYSGLTPSYGEMQSAWAGGQIQAGAVVMNQSTGTVSIYDPNASRGGSGGTGTGGTGTGGTGTGGTGTGGTGTGGTGTGGTGSTGNSGLGESIKAATESNVAGAITGILAVGAALLGLFVLYRSVKVVLEKIKK